MQARKMYSQQPAHAHMHEIHELHQVSELGSGGHECAGTR